jgi:MoxR-like ATPase
MEPIRVETSEENTAELIHRLEANVARVIRGKREVIRLCTVCLLARGHILIEDVPGVGKTTLSQALARSLGLAFQRIQFTSDLLPSDIIGVSIFNQKTQAFEFVPGPLFANVVLADEINRATPKTQSALLEAMSERKVSVELKPVVTRESLLDLQEQVARVRVADKLAEYILSLAESTRHGGDFLLGVSTRGAQSLFRASQALALCEGRGYVIPDDVQRLAPPVLGHRVVLKRAAGDLDATRKAIERVVASTPVPL